jgi:prephenate dehydrogenase
MTRIGIYGFGCIGSLVCRAIAADNLAGVSRGIDVQLAQASPADGPVRSVGRHQHELKEVSWPT